jgi:hypothetical protein
VPDKCAAIPDSFLFCTYYNQDILAFSRREIMAKFLFAYYGGKMETDPQKQKESMEAWMKWFAGLGKAVVDAGNPTMPGKLVSKGGTKDISGDAVTGYSIIQADNLDAALKIAKGSPQTSAGGQIAVYSIAEMM